MQKPRHGRQKIMQFLQRWMILAFAAMFAVTEIATYFIYTEYSMGDVENTFSTSIDEALNAIDDSLKNKMTEDMKVIAYSGVTGYYSGISDVKVSDIDDKDGDGSISEKEIAACLKKYAVAVNAESVHLIKEDGTILHSSNDALCGHTLFDGEKDSARSDRFMGFLHENLYCMEDVNLAKESTSKEYYAGFGIYSEAGSLAGDSDYIVAGYTTEEIFFCGITQIMAVIGSRRIGREGKIIVCDAETDENGDRMVYGVTGVTPFRGELQKQIEESEKIFGDDIDPLNYEEGVCVSEEIGGKNYTAMWKRSGQFYVGAFLPEDETFRSRNIAVTLIVLVELLTFIGLYFIIRRVVKNTVVKNFLKVADHLSEIAGGNLEARADVAVTEEFAGLSDDINTTVDKLKGLIDEAERRNEEDLKMARDIQYSALPSVFPPFPSRKEFEIFACMDTAKEVGGDFYDFYLLGENKLAFLVADVSGKGIPAALFMMRAKTVIKGLAEAGHPVEKIFTDANEKLCENNPTGMFVTAWMAILDTGTGYAEYANAGHTRPIVKRAGGGYEYIYDKGTLFLGGMEGIRYKKNELALNAGDEIFLYTDGVTEATDINEKLYGEDRLLELLNSLTAKEPPRVPADSGGMADSGNTPGPGVERLCRKVGEDIDRFVGDAPQFDDITMLAMMYKGK